MNHRSNEHNSAEVSLPESYVGLLANVKQRVRDAQYAALKAVNTDGRPLLGYRTDDH
jgi:hypothetical protein